MKPAFTVCFFGHRRIEKFHMAEERTEALVHSLMREKETVVFLVGRDGEYDQIVSSAIRKAQRELGTDNSIHIWVLPYNKAELAQNRASFESYYDEIEICKFSETAHPKVAIQLRNRSMVDRSDLCVFFVERSSGGAWRTMQYAIKQGKKWINLCDEN